jgi:hypothetical protein
VIFHSYVKLPEGNGIKILPWDLIGYNGTVEIELPNGISMVLLFCRFWTCLTMKNGDLAGIQTLTNHSAIGISSKGSNLPPWNRQLTKPPYHTIPIIGGFRRLQICHAHPGCLIQRHDWITGCLLLLDIQMLRLKKRPVHRLLQGEHMT